MWKYRKIKTSQGNIFTAPTGIWRRVDGNVACIHTPSLSCLQHPLHVGNAQPGNVPKALCDCRNPVLVLEHALHVVLKCNVFGVLQVQAFCRNSFPVVAHLKACLPLSCSSAPVKHNIAIKQCYSSHFLVKQTDQFRKERRF